MLPASIPVKVDNCKNTTELPPYGLQMTQHELLSADSKWRPGRLTLYGEPLGVTNLDSGVLQRDEEPEDQAEPLSDNYSMSHKF